MCKYNRNPHSNQCNNFFNKINHIKNYIINNPIGYVYRNKLRRPLSAWYNRDTRQYNYYVIDFFGKKPDGDDTIIHTIENKGLQLYDGDFIHVPTRGKMKIRINENIPSSFHDTIVYGDSNYNPLTHPLNRLNRYSGYNRYNRYNRYNGYNGYNRWQIVGYVKSDKLHRGKFFKLYEQEYLRDTFRYKIELYPGFYLDVVNPQSGKYSRTEDRYRFRNRLYKGDIVKIDTMKQNYRVHIYEYDDIY
jgi:hypothetical protein